jgi:phosphatidylinositol alpha-mannosyltransferase
VSSRWRWAWLLVVLVGAVLALRTLFGFPWRDMLDALTGANLALLSVAAVINFASPLFKGTALDLLLRGLSPVSWWAVQEANFIGTAVNSLSVGATGEATRIAILAERDGVPPRNSLLALAATKVAEGIALAGFIMVAPAALDLPLELRTVQAAGVAVLVFGVLFATIGRWERRLPNAPPAVRRVIEELRAVGGGRRLLLPVACGLGSWTIEWAVYHLVLRAMLGPVSLSASFTMLLAANVSGLLRLTPGNVGILQAATVAALVPFGFEAEDAIAAGLALQAVQMLPILAFTLIVVQRSGLGWAMFSKTPTTQESS